MAVLFWIQMQSPYFFLNFLNKLRIHFFILPKSPFQIDFLNQGLAIGIRINLQYLSYKKRRAMHRKSYR